MLSKKEQVKAMANILCESCDEQEGAYACMVLHKPYQGVIRHSENLYKHNCRVIDKPEAIKEVSTKTNEEVLKEFVEKLKSRMVDANGNPCCSLTVKGVDLILSEYLKCLNK